MDKNRHLLPKIRQLLAMFPAVAIIGPRQCGKSTLAKKLINDSWKYYDLESPDDYQLITSDPVSFFKHRDENMVIDEAQQYPELFNILRVVIDQDRSKCGRFILTGSSSPKIVRGLSESLAGRIATVELAPLKASEYFAKPLSNFYNLFSEEQTRSELIKELRPQLNLKQIYQHWFAGGYPEPRIKSEKTPAFMPLWKDNYFNDYIKRDIAALFPNISSHNFRLFLQTLTFHSGTTINKSNIARALEVSSVTVNDYLEIIHNTFIWRNLKSFEANSLKKVQKMPRGFFRDSGILHHLLKIKDLDQLLIHPHAGFSFESFVIDEIIRGVEATISPSTDFHFYRTIDKSEIDLIVDSPSGPLPIEIKLGTKFQKKDLKALEIFLKDMDAPLGLLINSSDKVEQITDKIFQIPVGCI